MDPASARHDLPYPLAVLYTRLNRPDNVGRLEALLAFGEGVARFLAWIVVAEAAAEGATPSQLEKWMSANSFGTFIGVIRTCLEERKKRKRRMLPELEPFRRGEPWKALKIIRDRRNGWCHDRYLKDDTVAGHLLRDLEPRHEALLSALSFLTRYPFGLLRPVGGTLGAEAMWLPCRGLSLHNAAVPLRGVAGAPFNILLLLDPGSGTALTLAPFFICNSDALCWLDVPAPEERKVRGVYARPAPGDLLPSWVPTGLLDVTGERPGEIPFDKWLQAVAEPQSLHRPKILTLDLEEDSVARVLCQEPAVGDRRTPPLPNRATGAPRAAKGVWPESNARSRSALWTLSSAAVGAPLLAWMVWSLQSTERPAGHEARVAAPHVAARPTMEGMAWLPGGTFLMGLSPQEAASVQAACREDDRPCPPARFLREQPARRVRVGAFFMDTREVTNAAFVAWLNRSREHLPLRRRDGVVYDRLGPITELDTEDTRGRNHSAFLWSDSGLSIKAGLEHHPVVTLTWRTAQAYCADRSPRGRLPTEAEWEFAARGSTSRRYPWATEQSPSCDGTVFGRLAGPCAGRSQSVAPVPVSAADRLQDVTPEGIFDLAGNASEWVYDAFQETYPPCQGVCLNVVPAAVWDHPHVVRGGDWSSGPDACRGSSRTDGASGHSLATVGFRCVVPDS